MTEKQLKNYLERGSEIEFNYMGKRYYAGHAENDEDKGKLCFYEYYTDGEVYNTFEEFSQNAKIDGKRVVEILYDIDDADVW